MANPLIARIEEALAEGMLPLPEAKFPPLETLTCRDLTRPYAEVFGQDGEKPEGFESFRPPYRLCFSPVPRRSPRPLLPPPVPAPVRSTGANLGWMGLQAVLDYYAAEGIEFPAMDRPLLDGEAVQEFFAPLLERLPSMVQDWAEYVLLDVENLLQFAELSLPFPCFDYNDEDSYSSIAFLEGPESVAGVVQEVIEGDVVALTPEDEELVAGCQGGWLGLLTTYADSSEDKLCDLRRLENCTDAYFGELRTKYPNFDNIAPYLASSEGDGVTVTHPDHIRFYIEYAEAFERVSCDNPGGYWFNSNESGVATRFIRDVLRVNRLELGLPPVTYEDEEDESYDDAA